MAMSVPTPSRADGLILQLPKDGTFARYELKIQFGENADRKGEGSLRVASVGVETVKGEKCRWIEVTMTIQIGGESHTNHFKLLVPEKQLKRGGDPLKHVVRAWQKDGDADPRSLDDPGSPNRPLAGMLAGPLENTKKLPAAPTSSKLGKLKCAGFKGAKTLSDPLKKLMVEMTVTTRTHAKAPFGVVTSRLVYAMTRDGKPAEKGTIEFRLTEVGEKAVSAIPGKN